MSKSSLDKQIEELQKQSAIVDKQVEAFEAEQKAKAEAEEEKKKEIPPYKVFGRDFSVTNSKVVEFYNDRLEMMCVQYKLVGRVNQQKQYIIPEKIKIDLVAMKKEIEEMGDDYYKVTALYMKKHFNFTIKLEMLEDKRAKASLFIAEYVGEFIDQNTLYTHIADFVDVYDEEYRIKLRKAFNLVDADAKNNDFDIPELAVLLQDLFDIDLYIGGLYDMASQIYVMRMLKLLESGGEIEQEVLARYQELLSGLENGDEANPRDINTKHKELLDKAIDSVGGLEKLTVDKKQLEGVLGEINKTNDAIKGLSVGGIMEVLNEDEGSKGSSGGGSKSVGGKAKKKPAKKGGSKSGGGKEKKKGGKDKKKGDKDKKGKSSGGGVLLEESSAPSKIVDIPQYRPFDPSEIEGFDLDILDEIGKKLDGEDIKPKPPADKTKELSEEEKEKNQDNLLDKREEEGDMQRTLNDHESASEIPLVKPDAEIPIERVQPQMPQPPREFNLDDFDREML